MKGLSRKNFSQVGRRVRDWFSAASPRLPERRNFGYHASFRVAQLIRDPLNSLYLAANRLNTHEAGSTLTLTPLIARPFVLLFEPDSNSRCRGQF